MADVVTVPSHLAVPEVRTYVSAKAVADLVDPAPSAPAAVDERGRSAQTFVVDVVVRSGRTNRRVLVAGRDSYATSAPLAVEAPTASSPAGRGPQVWPPPVRCSTHRTSCEPCPRSFRRASRCPREADP